MGNSIGRLSLDDLAKKVFVIPFYQRGYRWTPKEARKLFLDLKEFSDSGDPEYCLQPVVLQTVKNISFDDFRSYNKGYGECLRVVDGQQRLTTIALLMHAVGAKRDWEIYYVAEKRTLSQILVGESRGEECINNEFRDGVLESFVKRTNDEKEVLRNLIEKNGGKIFFLSYTISLEENDPEGHKAFLRLNDGKTPLTSSELIRALYMVNSSGLSMHERMEIAKEWEIIENTLRDDLFWLMFNAQGLSDTPTRIDLLFALVTNVSLEKAKANPRIVFEALEDDSDTGQQETSFWDLAKVWSAVLRCFWWMKSCYDDKEVFNYLCWINEFTDRSASSIYKLWQRYPKQDDFKKSIVKVIQDTFRNEGVCNLSGVTYGDWDNKKLCKLFVLLNVIECNKNFERFRFDRYKEERWDIEHIDSQTPNELADCSSKTEWLVSSFNELPESKKKEFRSSFPNFDEKDGDVGSDLEFDKMTQEIRRLWGSEEESEIKPEEKDYIGNLALLNTTINRSYKNALFPAKRKVIKESVAKDRCYVPPCTAKAFMKFYTESPSKITYWQKVDFDGYAAQLESYFVGFMQERTGALPCGRTVRTSDCLRTSSLVVQRPRLSNFAKDEDQQERFVGKVTFDRFMDRYRVVVPKIQRLYVQGRRDERGKKCLSSFAEALVGAVTAEGQCADSGFLLDFVYGIDVGNVFEPLDGQQRLTTLLLLAWLCGATKKDWSFRYESRRAADFFVRCLLENPPPPLVKPEGFAQRLKEANDNGREYLHLCSDYIKKSNWFLSAWMNDAGIAGMMEMLDSLYCKLLCVGKRSFSLSGISFFVNYLDTGSESYDQIFLKMNSRGKALSDWECYKSVLDKHVPAKRGDDEHGWQESLEEWQGHVWTAMSKNGRTEIEVTDKKMLEVVKLALACAGCTKEVKNTFWLAQWLDDENNSGGKRKFFDLCTTFFSATGGKDKELDKALTPIWESSPRWPDFSSFDSSSFYEPLLAYYAATKSTNPDWMRVVWNIIENVGVIDKGNFSSAYNLIEELSGHSNEVLRFLSNGEVKSAFAKDQIFEECDKARRMTGDRGIYYRPLIIMAEKNQLLRGRIQALLFTGDGKDTPEYFGKRIATFQSMALRLDNRTDAILFSAALLSIGDYTMRISGNNWRFVVDKKSLDYYLHNPKAKEFTRVFCELLTRTSVIGDCQKVCNDYIGSRGFGEWRYYFVKYRKVFLSTDDGFSGYYAWPGDFLCRRIKGETLHSSHSNPYLDAIGIKRPHNGADFNVYDGDKTISLQESDDDVSVTISKEKHCIKENKWMKRNLDNCDFVEWLDKVRHEWWSND